jgi:hypothetical protein
MTVLTANAVTNCAEPSRDGLQALNGMQLVALKTHQNALEIFQIGIFGRSAKNADLSR